MMPSIAPPITAAAPKSDDPINPAAAVVGLSTIQRVKNRAKRKKNDDQYKEKIKINQIKKRWKKKVYFT